MVRKNIDQAATNLDSSTAFIPERYESGVKEANWSGPAGSDQAESNYASGTQKAAANKTRQKMIKKVSNEEWKNKAIEVGKGRIASGIKANLDKYKTHFGPVLSAVNATAAQLPPRTSDPMANIDNRLKAIVRTAIKASPKNK